MRRILMTLVMLVGLFISPTVVAGAAVAQTQSPASVSATTRLPKHGPVVERDIVGRAKPSGASAKMHVFRVGTNITVSPAPGVSKWWKTTYRGKTIYVWKDHVSLNPERTLWASKNYAVRYAKRIFGSSFQCIKNIVNKESYFGGRHSTNGSTWGIPQALPGKKMAIDGAYWRDDPATQLRWMKRYVKKYGGPCAAWRFRKSHGWY